MSAMKINTHKLKIEMERAGYSKTSEMAGPFGMTRQALDRIIKDQTTTFKTLNRLADFFAIDPKDLLI